MHKKNIRVAVRGASGLLGSRFLAAVGRTADIRVTAGIVKNDPTLTRLIERCAFGGPLERQALPEKLYLDENSEIIERLNKEHVGLIAFRPLRELNIAASCDVVIDAAMGKDHVLQPQYNTFPGPIILQDGEYPRGRLIAPPLIAPAQGGNRYRQGGCLLSGLAPILHAFRDDLRQVRLHVVMQYDGRDTDFLITERTNTFRLADHYRPRMEEELKQLLPRTQTQVVSVIQIPGMLHYTVTLELELSGSAASAAIRQHLAEQPRLRLLPDSVTGTYEINLARVLDERIPPILVFGGSIATTPYSGRTLVRLTLALYYRTLAVLPNLDAIRILCQGYEPLEAMRQTDRDLGF